MLAYGLIFPDSVEPGPACKVSLTSAMPLTRRRWHPLPVTTAVGPAPIDVETRLTTVSARLDVPGRCRIEIEADPLRVTITAPRSVDSELFVHPLGAFIGAVAARWHGRTALHGAAVTVAGRTVAVLGAPASGKSTLAALLAARGHQVMTDDLVVIDDGLVLAGPASADLRADAAAHLQQGRQLPESIGRERFRVALDPPPLESELSALLVLGWADHVSAHPTPIADRLRSLAVNEALAQGPSRPDSFLKLLGLPCWSLGRPRDWSRHAEVSSTVEQLAAALPSPTPG